MYNPMLHRLLFLTPVALAACSFEVDPSLARDGGADASSPDGSIDPAPRDDGAAPRDADAGAAADAARPQPDSSVRLTCDRDAVCSDDAFCEPATRECVPRCSDALGCFTWRAPSAIGELASDGTRVYFSTLEVRDALGNITVPGQLFAWDGEGVPVALLETDVTSLAVADGTLYVFRLTGFVSGHHKGELVRVVEGATNRVEPVATNVTWAWASGDSVYWSEVGASTVALRRFTKGASATELLLERPIAEFGALRVGWFNGDQGHALRYVLESPSTGSTLTADDLSDATKSLALAGPFGGLSWGPTLVTSSKVYAWTEGSFPPIVAFDIVDPTNAPQRIEVRTNVLAREDGSMALRDGWVLWSAADEDKPGCSYGSSEDRENGVRKLLVHSEAPSALASCKFTLRAGQLVFARNEALYERALDQ